MFKDVKKQMEHLDEEMDYLDADWNAAEHRLLDFYVKIMPKVMNAERCSLFIADREGSGVWLRAGTGVREREIQLDMQTESVVAEAIRTGELVYRTGLDEANGAHKEVDAATGFETKDILCMPIRSLDGSRVTGAVQMLNKKGGEPYNDEEMETLREMLHFLELSIENIYFQQEATGVVGNLYKLLVRVTVGAVVAFIALLIFFSLYWFGFFLLG
jgi:GAF domain-containing protein